MSRAAFLLAPIATLAKCFYLELYKMARRGRTYLGFASMAVLMIPILYSLRHGSAYEEMTRERLSESFMVVGSPFNGAFFVWLVMVTIMRLVPFFVVLVGGESIAGEAASGTLRMLMVRPIPRSLLITAKFLAVLFYTTLLLAFIAGLSALLGTMFLGWGQLWIPEKGLWFYSADEAGQRLLLAYLFVILGTWVVAALAFLLSTLVENALGPAFLALTITVGFWTMETVEGVTQSPFLTHLKPFLFTTHFDIWKRMFDDPIPWQAVSHSGLISAAHILGFYLLALWIFKYKDWTC